MGTPVGRQCGLLCQDLANDGAADVGEAQVAAHVAVGEAGVVEAQQVQDGGLQVVHMHGVLGHLPRVLC